MKPNSLKLCRAVLLPLAISILMPFCLAAQQKQVLDSLQKAYNNAKHDTTKINILVELCLETQKHNFDSAFGFIEQALKLSDKIGNPEINGYVLKNGGFIKQVQGQNEIAIKYYLQAIEEYKKTNNESEIHKINNNLGGIFIDMGKTEEALHNHLNAAKYFEEKLDLEQLAKTDAHIGMIFMKKAEFEKALNYFNKALRVNEKLDIKKSIADNITNIGSCNLNLGKYEEAIKFYNIAFKINTKISNFHGIISNYSNMATAYIYLKDNRNAEISYLKALGYAEKLNSVGQMGVLYSNIGRIYMMDEQYDKAEPYLQKAITISETNKMRELKTISYGILAGLYDGKKEYVKALEYFQKYMFSNDSMVRENHTKSMAEMQIKYDTEKKEKEIVFQKTELEKKNAQINLYIALSIVIILLFAGILLYFRSRRKTEKLALEKKLVELEQKALSLQMNPHFIFNALNSISGFITDNDPVSAKKYLAKFAKLMRLILEGSTQQSETIKHEADLLENYLQLEQLRFNNKFEFNIEIDEQLDPETASIPPMLLQPQVENALLHGIMHKEQGGKIDVRFLSKGNKLVCEIEDNGIGREKSKSINPNPKGHKSMATSITQERIEIMNAKEEQHINYLIEDLLDETNQPKGTKVVMEFEQTY